jgi:hypothetical protein
MQRGIAICVRKREASTLPRQREKRAYDDLVARLTAGFFLRATILWMPAKGAVMNSELDSPKPTIADEASPIVDDQVVIERTLPISSRAISLSETGSLDKLLASTRSYVSAHPGRAALMALGGGALIAELAVLSLRRRSH